MERTISGQIRADLAKKMVFVTGPRQVGKTTLSKTLSPDPVYLNFDSPEHKKILMDGSWDRRGALIIFDEIHKMKNWKNLLKGIYDTEGNKPPLLVTGSGRLDYYRKGGDSLAGRYFLHRLHPFTIKELTRLTGRDPADLLDSLIKTGGFPEPWLSGDETAAARWRRTHIDVIIRQDLLDLEKVREIGSFELLVHLLRERVGSGVTYSSLAEDLQVSVPTVRHWLEILERLYVIFPVRPLTRNVARGILKESKYYFYDTGAVEGDPGVKLENTVACGLLAEIHFLEDTTGVHGELLYIRDKEKREVDFAVVIDNKVKLLLEVKHADDNFSRNLIYHTERVKPEKSIQLVRNLRQTRQKGEILMLDAANWLAVVDFPKPVSPAPYQGQAPSGVP
jgi:predicted AAA+ superfamily ATPase